MNRDEKEPFDDIEFERQLTLYKAKCARSALIKKMNRDEKEHSVVKEFERQLTFYRAKLKNSAMVEASNDFAARLLKEFAGLESICISPISISLVLAISLAGASGKTEAELVKLLGKGCSLGEIEPFFAEIKTLFQQLSELEILYSANHIYYDSTIDITETYKKKVTRLYGNKALDLSDFKNTRGTAKKINLLVEEITKGKVKNVISASQVDSIHLMILVNALCFRGKWETAFDPNSNIIKEFHLMSGKTKKTEMMRHNYESASWCFYYENDEMQRICLPYKLEYLKKKLERNDKNGWNRMEDAGEVSMYIILPREPNGFPKLLENLDGKKLLKWLQKEPLKNYQQKYPEVCDIEYEVDIMIPKFEVRSDIHFKAVMEKMGLEHYFTRSANFSGISSTPLYVNDFIQTSWIKTDEYGTEAITFSRASCRRGCNIKLRKKVIMKEFHADRPFLYAIVSRKQHVLFIGTIMDVDEVNGGNCTETCETSHHEMRQVNLVSERRWK